MSLEKEDLQSLLEEKGVSKNLYTHSVVSSLLTNLLYHFDTLDIKQLKHCLDEIMTVSTANQSFSLVLQRTGHDNIFSYQLKDGMLIYTKQSFVKNSCTIITKYFDQKGKCLHRNSITYPISEPESYRSQYYESNKKGISL